MQIAVEKFSEATVGYRLNREVAERWVQLFYTHYFIVTAVSASHSLINEQQTRKYLSSHVILNMFLKNGSQLLAATSWFLGCLHCKCVATWTAFVHNMECDKTATLIAFKTLILNETEEFSLKCNQNVMVMILFELMIM